MEQSSAPDKFKNNSKIAKNAVFLYIRMILLMAINLYIGRLILDVLGVVDYGIYNLVATIIVCFSFLKNALNDAALRFLTFEIGNGASTQKLRKLYSTLTNSFILLSFIIVIVAELLWVIWGKDLNIPPERFEAATFVYQFSLVTFVLSIMQIPFTATIIAYEQMKAFAKISIYESILKLLLIIVITFIDGDKLEQYSLTITANALIIYLWYRLYSVKHFPICKYRFIWDSGLLKSISRYTGWSLLGNVASVISETGVGLLFNHFCGVLLNAAIGVANQVNQAVLGFVYGYQTAFKPQVVKLYAAGQKNDFFNLVRNSSKYSYFLFFLISIPLIVYNKEILDIWLKDVPEFASSFSQIILVCSLIDATSGVFFFAIGATGKIRNYQVLITCSFILHVIITYIMLKSGLDYTLVFFSRILMRGVVNFIIGYVILKKLTGFPFKDFLKRVLLPILKFSIVPILVIMFARNYFEQSLFTMIIAILTFEIASIVSLYSFGLNANERKTMLAFIINKIRR